MSNTALYYRYFTRIQRFQLLWNFFWSMSISQRHRYMNNFEVVAKKPCSNELSRYTLNNSFLPFIYNSSFSTDRLLKCLQSKKSFDVGSPATWLHKKWNLCFYNPWLILASAMRQFLHSMVWVSNYIRQMLKR